MRKLATLALVAAGVLLLTPQSADAQGFWRYFERLSGPPVNGPGFELAFLCHGLNRGDGAHEIFPSLQCVDVSRDRPWVSLGLQTYRLGGENDLTRRENDRVDVVGVAPFVDFNFPFGVAVGGGVGVRRISAGRDSSMEPVGEIALKFRPFRFLAWSRTADRGSLAPPSLSRDFFEVRGIAVFEGGFEAGDFGFGSRPVDGGVNFGLVLAFNFFSEP